MPTFEDPLDEFETLLRPAARTATANLSLRDAVLNQTTGVIRTRRRLKRFAMAAALVGCYLAGMGTTSLFKSNAANQTMVSNADRSNAAKSQNQFAANSTSTMQDASPQTIADDSKLASEIKPTVALLPASGKLTAYDRLRMTGDRQLSEKNDIAGAAKTYRRALQLATVEQRAVSVHADNWLLMAMKNDQQP